MTTKASLRLLASKSRESPSADSQNPSALPANGQRQRTTLDSLHRRADGRPGRKGIEIKLYYSPGVCSLSPHIALREAGLPFELVKVDYATKQLPGGGDYRRLNPLGYVPLLELDDGQLLGEGPAIVQYIADLKPASGLAPAAGTLARYRLQEWLGFINSELHKAYSALFDPAHPAELKATIREKIGQRLDRVVERLQGRPWLLGERFGGRCLPLHRARVEPLRRHRPGALAGAAGVRGAHPPAPGGAGGAARGGAAQVGRVDRRIGLDNTKPYG